MSAGDAPRVELPPEFQSALEKLHELFVGALGDAKLNSCWSAWADIKRTKNAKKKIEIFNEQSSQWREGSADAIREWLPKFVDLATAYPEVIDDPIDWAKDSVWERVEGICGIQRPHAGELLPRDWVPNDVTVWWFAVASEGNPEVNLPPLRPWSAPRWLARDRRETEELLERHAGYLCIRVNRVIKDVIAEAEIRRASNRKLDEHRADPQSAKSTTKYRLTFQTGVQTPPLHPVLTSVRRRFLDDAGDILMSSKTRVFEQIKANFEAASDPADLDDKTNRTQNAHVVLRTGLADCLDSFVSSARDYYNKLVKIARANAEWNIDDSPEWARCRIQELLDEKLSKPGVSGLPALDRWFRWACDGWPDFDRGESGFSEPWCAPVWCVHPLSVSAWTKRRCPERLTAELTQKVINSARWLFDERLRNQLVLAEDEARIELHVKKGESFAIQGTTQPCTETMKLKSTRPEIEKAAQHAVSATSEESALLTVGHIAKTRRGPDAKSPSRLIFAKNKNAVVAKQPFTDDALLNTYDCLSEDLLEVRAFVIGHKGRVSVPELKNRFRRTELQKAAADPNWENWIHLFSEEQARARGIALVHLEHITGLTRGTIKTRCSRARAARRLK